MEETWDANDVLLNVFGPENCGDCISRYVCDKSKEDREKHKCQIKES